MTTGTATPEGEPTARQFDPGQASEADRLAPPRCTTYPSAGAQPVKK